MPISPSSSIQASLNNQWQKNELAKSNSDIFASELTRLNLVSANRAEQATQEADKLNTSGSREDFAASLNEARKTSKSPTALAAIGSKIESDIFGSADRRELDRQTLRTATANANAAELRAKGEAELYDAKTEAEKARLKSEALEAAQKTEWMPVEAGAKLEDIHGSSLRISGAVAGDKFIAEVAKEFDRGVIEAESPEIAYKRVNEMNNVLAPVARYTQSYQVIRANAMSEHKDVINDLVANPAFAAQYTAANTDSNTGQLKKEEERISQDKFLMDYIVDPKNANTVGFNPQLIDDVTTLAKMEKEMNEYKTSIKKPEFLATLKDPLKRSEAIASLRQSGAVASAQLDAIISTQKEKQKIKEMELKQMNQQSLIDSRISTKEVNGQRVTLAAAKEKVRELQTQRKAFEDAFLEANRARQRNQDDDLEAYSEAEFKNSPEGSGYKNYDKNAIDAKIAELQSLSFEPVNGPVSTPPASSPVTNPQ